MVDRRANRDMIKKVIEYVFNVSVTNVNTQSLRKSVLSVVFSVIAQYKKAIVTVKDRYDYLFPDM